MKAKIIEIFSDIFNAGMDAQEVGMPSFDQLQQTGWFNSKIDDIESLYQPQIDKLKEIIAAQDVYNRHLQIDIDYNKCRICDKLSLDLDNPWPLYDVLQKLIWASEYLLNEKSYDGGNYEEISHCVKRGKEILKKIKP